MRGNPIELLCTFVVHGSIPACAGEPPLRGHFAGIPWVYPRVCGGTPWITSPALNRPGLSPRVRGNHLIPAGIAQREGSIPACAGEPVTGVSYPGASGVYPRVCGGTPHPHPHRLCVLGLSPRVRGNRVLAVLAVTPERSIPACAGEPLRTRICRTGQTVYPRVCGGTLSPVDYTYTLDGLSPRVRGNPSIELPTTDYTRSIPACAGEPPGRTGRNGKHRVYPRVCGGTAITVAGPEKAFGLSPRVRGNQPRGRGYQHG